MVLAVALRVVQEGRQRWERLSKREHQELMRIVRKSRGRPANLTPKEREELWRIVRKAASLH
jgi:DNA-binding CsgD family transcriptional regulator